MWCVTLLSLLQLEIWGSNTPSLSPQTIFFFLQGDPGIQGMKGEKVGDPCVLVFAFCSPERFLILLFLPRGSPAHPAAQVLGPSILGSPLKTPLAMVYLAFR